MVYYQKLDRYDCCGFNLSEPRYPDSDFSFLKTNHSYCLPLTYRLPEYPPVSHHLPGTHDANKIFSLVKKLELLNERFFCSFRSSLDL